MVLGSPGGDDQCIRTLQTFLNVVDFGMNVQQAIEDAALVDAELSGCRTFRTRCIRAS